VNNDEQQKELTKPVTPDVFVVVSSRKATPEELTEKYRDEAVMGAI
jgi:hypothetical protein